MTRRKPSQYSFPKLEFDEQILKKHFTAPRRLKIKSVTIHHMTVVGKDTTTTALDACYNIWQNRVASANYGVQGTQVRQYVWDSNASWANASTTGNHESITIEHTNSSAAPNWYVSEATWQTGAKLTAYIHKVYGLGRPVKGKTVKRHRDWFATACPGPYLGDKIYDAYVKQAQKYYDAIGKTPTTPAPVEPPVNSKPRVSFKVATKNGAGYDSVKGEANALKRVREQLVPDIKKNLPDALCVQEWSAVGEPDMVSETDRLLTTMQREAIKKGVGVYRRKASTNHAASGVIELAPRLDGNDKQCAWMVVTKQGVRVLVGSPHLTSAADNKGGYEARLGQTRSMFKQLLVLGEKLGVDKRNIVIAGDFNSETAILKVAAEFGFVDALSIAKTKVNAKHDSFNGWKKTPQNGEHLDHVLVHKDAVVTKWLLSLDDDGGSDHNGLTVTLELVA